MKTGTAVNKIKKMFRIFNMCKTWDRIRIRILDRHQNGKSDPDRHQNNVEPQHSLQQNKTMRTEEVLYKLYLLKGTQD
jgi:hypothetical protein